MAADQGDANAQCLRIMCKNGQGVSGLCSGDEVVSKCCRQGLANAQFSLGFMYDSGQGVAQDYAAAMKWYRMAANERCKYACNLGIMYASGQTVAQDDSAAMSGIEWLQTRLAKAQYLGSSTTMARAWLRLFGGDEVVSNGCRSGICTCEYNLGVMYNKGKSVAQDYSAAMVVSNGCNQGLHMQLNLGVMYDNGQGVAQDYSGGEWYEWLQTKGAKAQLDLGVMYDYGQGVAQDDSAAMKWYRMAAKLKCSAAQSRAHVL